MRGLLLKRVGRSLQARELANLGNELRKVLCLPNEAVLPIRRLLTRLLGREMTDDDVDDLSVLLTKGEDRIRKDRPFGELFAANEEVDIRCEEVLLDGTMALMKIRILSGAMLNEVRYHKCSPSFVQWLGRVIGLNGRQRRSYHPREFVGMQFKATVKREKMATRIARFNVSASQKRSNSKLKCERKKHAPECKQEGRCHYCPIGADTCELATHQRDWMVGDCEKGHRSFFDDIGCLFCQDKEYKENARISTFEPPE